MKHDIQSAEVQNNFRLKDKQVDLISTGSRASSVSLADLERGRVAAGKLSASKHGLEVICGASCETGAQ